MAINDGQYAIGTVAKMYPCRDALQCVSTLSHSKQFYA
jgi:hypothetical protein